MEDDGELREALAETLEARGHDVIAVPNGKDALRVMRERLPDIVVLDLMMPVMDGWQFRVEQKKDPKLAETPVVAISANQSPVAAAVDADLYLQKPIDGKTLSRAIEDVLLTKARRDEPVRIAQTERLAALGTLAAGLAHEINNPLTYVLLHLTNAVRLLPDATSPTNQAQLERVDALLRGALEGVERIRAITSGVRAFSRVEELGAHPTDLHVVLDAAIKLVMHQLRHRATLETSFGSVPLVHANEGRLGQVFLNLLSNAIQALPEGEASSHVIGVTTGTDDRGRAVVEVSDTGEGIPAHVLPRIFEPFFSTKPIGRGTGLGLSISQGIVRAMGGEIQVESTVGRGTTFRIVLPPSSKHAPSPAHVGVEIEAPRRRILVIDDEEGVRNAIRDALPGQDIVTARSGREALDLLTHDASFDFVLCDLHMPDVTGMDLYTRMKARSPELASRFVFMTAGAFTERGRHFIATENLPVLDKPLDLGKLRTLIAKAT